MAYCIYILFSPRSKIYYVGQTSELSSRLIQHNQTSLDSFTSKHRPWELKATIDVADIDSAIKLEKYIKSQKRKVFVELVIQKHNDNDFLNWIFQKSGIKS